MSKSRILIKNKFYFLDNRFLYFSLYVLQKASYNFVTGAKTFQNQIQTK